MIKRNRLLAITGLVTAVIACTMSDFFSPTPTLESSETMMAEFYATVFVYDAIAGEGEPIPGAVTSLCESTTSELGLAACPWLTGKITKDWWEASQELGRRVTINVQAEGYEPITVIRYGWETRSPHFKIGLLPLNLSTDTAAYFNLTASTGLGARKVVAEGEQIVIEVLRGSWGAWGGPGGCYNRADGAGFTDEYRKTIPVPSAPVGALIGTIDEGPPFLIGNRLEMIVPESGMLSLGINDNDLADNCGELVIRILSEGSEKRYLNLVKNGNFFQGLEFWEIQRNALCEHCRMEVIPGDAAHPYILIWERSESNRRPAAMRVYQRPDIDLRGCTSLKLSFDVRLDHYNLPNSGSRFHAEHGEYPAKITIRFLDPESQRIEWTRGFLYSYDDTPLVNYTLVPPAEWYTYSVDLLDPENWVDHTGEAMPRALTLYEFNISGSGYDFKAAISNLRLEGCQPGID